MKTLYALLVGINDYPVPVRRLKGCLRDVESVQAMLGRHFSDGMDLQIRILTDDGATYDGIVAGFREHLRQAAADDVVFFHFSGHGTEAPTATEFEPLEHTGKDQALVCYDSIPAGRLLADKELAVLLHEVATLDARGEAKAQPPHIVVSLDCCHSGSGTRDLAEDPLMNTRSLLTQGNDARPLATYLDYYQKQLDEGRAELSVPAARHVALSACESVQKAGDKPEGGYFTQGLIRAIDSEGGRLNYADLLVRARAYVRRERKNQNPQFATIGNFNPFTRFLDGAAEGTPDRREVFFEKNVGCWYIRYGAIHGLPTDPKEPVEVDVFAAGEEAPVARTTIRSVGAIQSVLDLEGDASLDAEADYWGVLHHLPAPPAFVRVHGDDAAAVERLKQAWDASKNVHHVDAGDEGRTPALEVEATAGAYQVRDLVNRRLIGALKGGGGALDEVDAETLISDLGRIVRWDRTRTLEHPTSRIANWFEFELDVLNHRDGAWTPTKHTGKEIRLYLSEDNAQVHEGNLYLQYRPRVRVMHEKQDLYFYLLFLNTDYSISMVDDEAVFRPEDAVSVVPLAKQEQWFGLAAGEQEAEMVFKLLATTEELDYQQLLQERLMLFEEDRNVKAVLVGPPPPTRLFNEWAEHTMRVTLVRQEDEIRPDRDLELAGGIRIRRHPGVAARVSLGSIPSPSRSGDPASGFARFDDVPGVEMVGLGSDRAFTGRQVLELDEIRVDAGALEDRPLEIVLPDAASRDPQEGVEEVVVPVAFDGEHFRVIGDSVVEGRDTVVRIRELPEPAPLAVDAAGRVVNPFGEEPEDRSLFKALKMAFFKVVLHNADQFRLCAAEFGADGSVIRVGEDLRDPATRRSKVRERVEPAERILLVVHGIIGDTGGIAEGAGRALGVREDGRGAGSYDLVLTFDYENLNTPISETAGRLKDELAAVGLDAEHGKSLTILAHSMGGLVSRWFIERLEGDQVVDRLILAGTPNAGSLFGRLDDYRRFAALALELSVNFIASLIPFAGRVFSVLQKAGQVTETLAQMKPESEFLRALNSGSAPPIPYVVLGGDVRAYQEAEEGNPQVEGFGRLVDKVLARTGNWVYQGEANDVAVSLASIFSVGDGAETVPVPCHHLNYFCSNPGVEALQKVL